MKKRLFEGICCILAAFTIFTSCADKPKDPLMVAVENGIRAKNPDLKNICFTEFEVVDSITVERQIEMSAEVFELRRDALLKRAKSLRLSNHHKNAIMRETQAETAESYRLLVLTLRDRYANSLDSILYYCVKFSGDYTIAGSGNTVFNDWYATVTPSGKTFNIQQGHKGILVGMGNALEGYKDLKAINEGEGLEE